ncbi:Hydroxyacylglutathione hydrolase, mitochondrial [Hondaea fermentalgiana]|uniref:Hydroxyacylglutathione hydrolase, mitochondrial n=1 Tax=Hondaea fermentalgiana TaxID=2315210 RepID=A0A2R5GUY9_9STRA|nr:Hydroxyacylglutathione hydrolase, mitochondrial [Hondaea fermentalgiana]|eukprot:GBG32211.1 Hydroxyacylglutathione hydrolase, mitochondrial [Hondaea fermentalgiana]
MSYLGLAAVGALVAAGAFKLRGTTVFDVKYFLYTFPMVGGRVHQARLQSFRNKSKHSSCNGANAATFLDGPEQKIAVRTVPYLSDNYAFLIIDYARDEVAVVDPADARGVVEAVAKESERCGKQLRITDALITHYHADHAGGNVDLCKLVPGVRIFGSSKERNFGVPGTTVGIQDGSVIPFGGLDINVVETPGHTQGHVSFYIPVQPGCETAVIFTGDALFVAGAGRFFEGTGKDAIRSMKFYRSLAPETLVFPGHEYAADNFDYACWLEPENESLAARRDWAHALREQRKPIVPMSLEHELTYNPFLRFDDPALLAALPEARHRAAETENEGDTSTLFTDADPAEVLQTLRDLKDAGVYQNVRA